MDSFLYTCTRCELWFNHPGECPKCGKLRTTPRISDVNRMFEHNGRPVYTYCLLEEDMINELLSDDFWANLLEHLEVPSRQQDFLEQVSVMIDRHMQELGAR